MIQSRNNRSEYFLQCLQETLNFVYEGKRPTSLQAIRRLNESIEYVLEEVLQTNKTWAQVLASKCVSQLLLSDSVWFEYWNSKTLKYINEWLPLCHPEDGCALYKKLMHIMYKINAGLLSPVNSKSTIIQKEFELFKENAIEFIKSYRKYYKL